MSDTLLVIQKQSSLLVSGLHAHGSNEAEDLLTINNDAHVSFDDGNFGTVELEGSFGGATSPRFEVMAIKFSFVD